MLAALLKKRTDASQRKIRTHPLECLCCLLPPEVIVHAFGFLHYADLYRCMFVNKYWHIVSGDRTLWEKLYCSYWGEHPDEYLLLRDVEPQRAQAFNFRTCFIHKRMAERGMLFSPQKPKFVLKSKPKLSVPLPKRAKIFHDTNNTGNKQDGSGRTKEEEEELQTFLQQQRQNFDRIDEYVLTFC